MRSIHSGNEIAELLFYTFSEDQRSSTSIRQLWEVHTLIIVIENSELIGMDVLRTWYRTDRKIYVVLTRRYPKRWKTKMQERFRFDTEQAMCCPD